MNVELQLAHAAPEPGSPLTVKALLRITGETPQGVEHTPMNLALVLDRSGSMSGEKMEWVREAAALLVRRVWPEDALSVVAYDDQVEVLASGAKGDGHTDAVGYIDGLYARGMTNLSGGWLRGRDLVQDVFVPAGVNRVVLMTDGLANQGITDRHSLAELCRSAAAAGITTTTIGFGADFDEDLLRIMADAGGGAAYYVERPDQAPGIFEEEVEGLLSLAAQNVTVDLRLGDGARLAAVRHTYPATDLEDGVRLEVGDLYAREPRLVLVELLLADVAPGAEVSLGRIRVAGHAVGQDAQGQPTVTRQTVDLPVTFTLEDGPRVDAEVERVALMLKAAQAREEALKLRERGDYGGAANVLRWAAQGLDSLDDEEAVHEARELSAMSDLVAEQALGRADVKYMKQRAHDSHRSRMSARKKYRRD